MEIGMRGAITKLRSTLEEVKFERWVCIAPLSSYASAWSKINRRLAVGSKSRDSAFDAVCTMSITIKLKLIGTWLKPRQSRAMLVPFYATRGMAKLAPKACRFDVISQLWVGTLTAQIHSAIIINFNVPRANVFTRCSPLRCVIYTVCDSFRTLEGQLACWRQSMYGISRNWWDCLFRKSKQVNLTATFSSVSQFDS